MKNLKDYLTESLEKQYAYRIKLAYDCDTEYLDLVEKCLEKYDLVSIVPFNRTPITKNPVEFTRTRGKTLTSEVCTTDVILKYPINERILEVWIASNLNLDHDRVLCYGIAEPRQMHAEQAARRAEEDEERYPTDRDKSLLANYEEMPESAEAIPEVFYGEEYNKKFLETLSKAKQEKGEEYFANHYPSKDKIMGDNLQSLFYTMLGRPNMGRGAESRKEVEIMTQAQGKM